VEFQREIRPEISEIMKLLQDSDEDVRQSVVNCLSSLGAQGTYYLEALYPAEAASQWSFSRRFGQQFLGS
jgi:signal transduction histidine kinase